MPQASQLQRVYRATPRSERTRRTILEAAEIVFAQKGYAAARLEDVAQRVGIRRASIVYYFRNKRELYHAVLASVFGDLAERYQTVIGRFATSPARIEAIINEWVSHVNERPSIGCILLREAAEASGARRTEAARYVAPAVAAVVNVIRDGQRERLFRPIDPIHFIFAVVGTTIFFVAATPTLVPDWPFDPLSPEQLDALRAEVLEITRQFLLGSGDVATVAAEMT